MLEDFNDKLRRNLVVFCGAYLALTYVGANWSEFLRLQYLEKAGPAVDANRIQHVAALVFLYLVFRWGTSEECSKGYAEVKMWWLHDAKGATYKRIHAAFHALPAQLPKWIKLPTETTMSDIQDWHKNAPKMKGITPTQLVFSLGDAANILFAGDFDFSLHMVKILSMDPAVDPKHGTAKVSLPMSIRSWIVIKASFMALFRKHSWEWLVPTLLTAVTGVVILWRMF